MGEIDNRNQEDRQGSQTLETKPGRLPQQQMKKKRNKRNNLIVEGDNHQEVIDVDNFW